jgi:hypothetical protein
MVLIYLVLVCVAQDQIVRVFCCDFGSKSSGIDVSGIHTLDGSGQFGHFLDV